MRSLHAVVLIGFLAVFSTSSLYGQWNVATGQMSTGNFVAIGNNTAPYFDTALRLSNPVGEPAAPCSTFQPVIYKCMQLVFGSPTGQWWGFKLDGNNDLHLLRDSDSGWKEGVTFARAGKVTINGGTMPLRIDAVNAGGFGAEFFDMTQYGYANGVGLNMTGNSHISVSNLQLGNAGVPSVRSNTCMGMDCR